MFGGALPSTLVSMDVTDPCLALKLSFGDPVHVSDLLTAAVNISPTADVSVGTSQLPNKTEQFYSAIGSDSINVLDSVKFYLYGIVSPAICAFGLVGNALNIIVLTRRRMQTALDCSMERAAHVGLIALAISDMLYCLSVLPHAFLNRSQVAWKERSFWMYMKVYGPCFQNIFMNTSIWLTVIMAVGRYAAICRPLHARYMVGASCTRIAVILSFVIWTLFQLPLFWTYKIIEFPCDEYDQTYYIIDHGEFILHNGLKTGFTYAWSALGYFVPVLVLAYCNVHLIRALRESYRMRKLYRVHQKNYDVGSRITPTLIAIVCMFIILVSPSEILHFYYYTIQQDRVEKFNLAIVITNVLQTLNFGLNFILYCIVNAHFRQTWKELLYCMVRRDYSRVNKRFTVTWHSNTSKSFVGPPSVGTFESVV